MKSEVSYNLSDILVHQFIFFLDADNLRSKVLACKNGSYE